MSIRVDMAKKGGVIKEIHRKELSEARSLLRYLRRVKSGMRGSSPLADEISDLVDRVGHQVDQMRSGKKDKLELHLRVRSVAALRIATSPRVRESVERAGLAVEEARRVYDSLRRPNKATRRSG